MTVSYFSALLLNFCDFSRFAPDRRAVRIGNFWGLPVNFTAFAVVSVTVTAGSLSLYGKAITDPVLLVARVNNKAVLVLAAITFTVATIGINVVANFVSPAFDIANLWPSKVSFRTGGFITAGLALVVMPWKIYSTPVIINDFLGTLGASLGPLFGIMMLDFYLRRPQHVVTDDLYRGRARGGVLLHQRSQSPGVHGLHPRRGHLRGRGTGADLRQSRPLLMVDRSHLGGRALPGGDGWAPATRSTRASTSLRETAGLRGRVHTSVPAPGHHHRTSYNESSDDSHGSVESDGHHTPESPSASPAIRSATIHSGPKHGIPALSRPPRSRRICDAGT